MMGKILQTNLFPGRERERWGEKTGDRGEMESGGGDVGSEKILK
jgi:hypothetical protein